MRKAFTLVEVMVTLILVLILATLAMAGYRQAVDSARQKVCATNLITLQMAIENHFLTTGISPAILGEIRPECLRDAYAQVMKEQGLLTKLAYLLVQWHSPKQAYAQINNVADLVDYAKMKGYDIPLQVFQCPADHTPPPGGTSYGISYDLRSYARWRDVPADLVLVGDCESPTFTDPAQELEPRHLKDLSLHKLYQGVTKGGNLKKEKSYRIDIDDPED